MSENESKESEGERAGEDESKGGEVGGGGGGDGVGEGGWGVGVACRHHSPWGLVSVCNGVCARLCGKRTTADV